MTNIVPTLTPIEKEILYLVGDGHTNNSISDLMHYHTSTVATVVRKLFVKFSIDSKSGSNFNPRVLLALAANKYEDPRD